MGAGMNAKALALVASLLYCPALMAQSLVEAPMMAQTQMRMGEDGHVSSCGMRVFGFVDAGNERQLFDTSLLVNVGGYGLGKLAGSVGPATNNPADLKQVEIYGGWFRKQGGSPTMPIKPYMAGEDPKSKLFIADFAPTIEVLEAIVMSQPIHLSISWKKGTSVIYFGVPVMDNPQREQFLGCVSDLMKTMESRPSLKGK